MRQKAGFVLPYLGKVPKQKTSLILLKLVFKAHCTSAFGSPDSNGSIWYHTTYGHAEVEFRYAYTNILIMILLAVVELLDILLHLDMKDRFLWFLPSFTQEL